MIRGCAKPHKQFSVETEGGELVADALFSSWSRGLDGRSQPFERGSLVVAPQPNGQTRYKRGDIVKIFDPGKSKGISYLCAGFAQVH